MSLKTRKQIIEALKDEIAEQEADLDRVEWINDEEGMWMQGYLKALENTLNKIERLK